MGGAQVVNLLNVLGEGGWYVGRKTAFEFCEHFGTTLYEGLLGTLGFNKACALRDVHGRRRSNFVRCTCGRASGPLPLAYLVNSPMFVKLR